ncbi:acetyl-CoA acetyltransferase [Microbacterium resistens]|uniref:propanoyl-CoA C-acyltransferase n=1 Tax=Microbacterium resistens TaxID=156977 RepID=A0ABU1SES4_9MICO|nr:lipid-transfer protein [Microbacterium resistens]MDR6868089.1 acetyl-CoA acetyltransferase [Microbacterium resistens]
MSVVVAGVGMIPFATPRHSESYDRMGAEAARRALGDAGIVLADVDQAFVGYVYADSAAGQTALYGLGPTGIPVVNVNNWCASGSTALWLGRQAILSGTADCVLVLGFEQMARGAIAPTYVDRPDSLWRFAERLPEDEPEAPVAARYFGAAGRAYLDRYDADVSLFAEVAVKARRHAASNPAAVFRDPVTVEEVLGSPHVFGPLTRLQCCPPTCGAAAAILCSEDFARSRGLDASVRIRAQSMTSDLPDSFAGDPIALIGAGIARRAADAVYEAAGVDPEEIPVAELHDCFTANEVISYEALRLTPEGTATRFVREGQNTYGGRVVTNPSGGLLSKGHPLGATGLAQCAELVGQLRGRAGARQVEGATLALQHNLGLGSACVVTLYESVRGLG